MGEQIAGRAADGFVDDNTVVPNTLGTVPLPKALIEIVEREREGQLADLDALTVAPPSWSLLISSPPELLLAPVLGTGQRRGAEIFAISTPANIAPRIAPPCANATCGGAVYSQ